MDTPKVALLDPLGNDVPVPIIAVSTCVARYLKRLPYVWVEGNPPPPPKFKLTTNPPAKEQAALIKTGDATDGALKGKRFALMKTSDTTQSRLRFVYYSGSRQAKVIKAKKTAPYNHSVHGLMIKAALPSLKKVKKITVEQVGPGGREVYSICAPMVSKKPVRLNGFKGK